MKKLLLFFSLVGFSNAYSQDYTIMYYNILWYNQDTNRDIEYLKILEEVNPDIVVAIELSNRADDHQFFRNVIKEYNDSFRKGNFHPSNSGKTGCDVNIYFDKDEFTLLNQEFIKSDPRDFAVYELEVLEEKKSLILIGGHLKASRGGEHAIRRKNASDDLIHYLNRNDMDTNIILGGDFNFYSSSEPAYQLLIEDGNFFDPLGEGNWHDNEEFREIHTQSTRVRGFGGGGMDDRFDFIMFSKDFLSHNGDFSYVIGSYHDLGNDGGDFNEAINDGNNSEVSSEIADALFKASDHLPVIVKIKIP